MGKPLNTIQRFYIDHNAHKMSADELAKAVGCTTRTIYNYINKNKGDQRTEQGREATKEPSPPVVVPQEQTPQDVQVTAKDLPPSPNPLPPPGMHLIGVRKHGTSGAVVMTKEAAEVGDDVAKLGQTRLPSHVYVINPNKE